MSFDPGQDSTLRERAERFVRSWGVRIGGDPICPAAMTRALAGWFEAQGADVQVLWHPGGHEIRPEEGDGIGGFLAA